jgi:hypothetical protein
MKYIFKYIAAAFVMAAIALQSMAQTHENVGITASAEVLTALKLTKVTDVNFGTLSSTTDGIVFLDPQGTNHAYVGSSAKVGKFTIEGESSTQINISWDENITLTTDATDELAWNLQVNGNTTDDASGSIELSMGGGPVTTAETDESGIVYWLYVGGELGGTAGSPSQLSSQATGTYTGTANLSVAYN